TGDRPELVVAPAALAREAMALGSEFVILEGRAGARALRGGGWSTSSIVPLPDRERPELLLPVGQAEPVRYAVRRWRRGETWRRRLRNATARELIARGVSLPVRPPTIVAARTPGPPYLVARALDALPVASVNWFAAFGRWTHPYSRGAFFLLEPGAAEPSWVLKLSRMPGLGHLFDEDERGLRLVERSPAVVADHSTRLVDRFEVDGLHGSVETAAVGTPFALLDASPAGTRGLPEAIDEVAAWIVRLARETVAPATELAGERAELARSVVPRWPQLPESFLDDLPPIAAVFRHGDLSPDNVFIAPDRITIVDWESAREHAMPLWDMLYFLTGALALQRGVRSEDERVEFFVHLWRGDAPESRTLFRWTRAIAEATDVPAEAVGPLATLLWLSYALIDTEHAERVERVENRPRAFEP